MGTVHFAFQSPGNSSKATENTDIVSFLSRGGVGMLLHMCMHL